jgi:hypothetical protein
MKIGHQRLVAQRKHRRTATATGGTAEMHLGQPLLATETVILGTR